MLLPKEFYFVRHGQTDHNKYRPKTDHGDIPLNETGRGQAIAIEPIIAQLPVKTICHSPLLRVKETKDLITGKLSASHIEVINLTECSQQIWDMMTTDSEAEVVRNFHHRVLQGVNEALSHPGPVLIVAHGGVHFALCSFMNVDHNKYIDNCVPVHFVPGKDGLWTATKLKT